MRPALETNHSRRAFLRGLAGILAAGVAPAFIGSSVLMPVRKLVVPAFDVGWTRTGYIESGAGVTEITMQFVIKAMLDEDKEKLMALASGAWQHKDGGRIVMKI